MTRKLEKYQETHRRGSLREVRKNINGSNWLKKWRISGAPCEHTEISATNHEEDHFSAVPKEAEERDIDLTTSSALKKYRGF